MHAAAINKAILATLFFDVMWPMQSHLTFTLLQEHGFYWLHLQFTCCEFPKQGLFSILAEVNMLFIRDYELLLLQICPCSTIKFMFYSFTLSLSLYFRVLFGHVSQLYCLLQSLRRSVLIFLAMCWKM